MAIILAYDISARHTEIKNHMIQTLGYLDRVSATGDDGAQGFVHLPNTTLYHENRTKHQAYSDIESAAKALAVVLERAVVYRLTDPVDGRGLMTNS
jgi:hypothetical protein